MSLASLDHSAVAAGRSRYQRAAGQALPQGAGEYHRAGVDGACLRLRAVGGGPVLRNAGEPDSLHRAPPDLDGGGQLLRRLRLLARPAVAGHAADRHRRRLRHPHLLRRLHGARGRLLPLLRLPQPLHVLHADADPGQQLSADVRRLGGRRPGVVPAHRLLVPEALGGECRQEGVHHQPCRRLRIPDRAVSADQALRNAAVRRRIQGRVGPAVSKLPPACSPRLAC